MLICEEMLLLFGMSQHLHFFNEEEISLRDTRLPSLINSVVRALEMAACF